MTITKTWDLLGIMVSLGCAIHCAVLPVVMTSLPLFGINIIENALFEYAIIGLAAIIGWIALRHGFVYHHRQARPLILFFAGMALLLAKQVWHQWQPYLLMPAVLLVLAAHWSNYRLSRDRQASEGS